MKKCYTGWALKLPYEYPALAGVLFFGVPPVHCEAIRTAVFKTRRQADDVRKTFAKGSVVRMSKIVRVGVSIVEISNVNSTSD